MVSINNDTPLVLLTVGQLKEIIGEGSFAKVTGI